MKTTVPKDYVQKPYIINAPQKWHEGLAVLKMRTSKTKGNLIKEAVEQVYQLS